MSDPCVSIVIPTYNRAALLPRALDSVLAQTFGDWEIVLVDDGSMDGTRGVVRCYADRLGDRLQYFRQENQGSSSARNRGIDVCRGRFVAFLDSDDAFLPHKLERQLALFEACPEVGLVYSDFSYVDVDGRYHASAFDTKCRLAREVPHRVIEPGLCLCSKGLFDVLLREYFIATIVGMVRREVLGETIRFAVDQAYAEEWLFYLMVVRQCRAGFVDEALSVHHHVEGSLARTDKHRNVSRYHDLLLAMEGRLEGLTRKQRTVILGNLQQASRQLGYDAHRAGRHREAFAYFIESLRLRPGIAPLGEVMRAAGRWWLGGRAHPKVGGRAAQGASEVVR
jgi:glycosyltransferase involved in cell wall biosynthesis